MAAIPPPYHKPLHLDQTDRAELCRRADFPALLAADGIELKKNGAAFVCAMRNERTPSCYIYPPGVGRYGAAGWTWHDYGNEKGGDVLGYLVDVRGLDFLDAARLLAEMTHYWPEGLQPAENDPAKRATRPERPPTHAVTPPQNEPPRMTMEEQGLAVFTLLATLSEIHPDTQRLGAEYLAGRGVLPRGWPSWTAYHLPAEACAPLAARLADLEGAANLARAGLLKLEAGKAPRLAWWGENVLLVCHDGEAEPLYLVARRLDWAAGDRYGKYINQPCAAGAVRWPFNLPALYAATGNLPGWGYDFTRSELLLVEGPLDALGAAVLGWPAVALLNRPQAHGWNDRNGAAARMLEVHLPAMRSLPGVYVVPDNDPGEKGQTGYALAARLVAWLRAAGVKADLQTLGELCEHAPAECKDLADVAAYVKQHPEAEVMAPPPAAKGKQRSGLTADTVRGW